MMPSIADLMVRTSSCSRREDRSMDQTAFALTLLFMLIGPIKVVPAFAAAMKGADAASKRKTAIYAALLASTMCGFIVFAGQGLITKYRLSVAGLDIAAGLVLLIAALRTMFSGSAASRPEPAVPPKPLQVAMSPLATPAIIPPAGVALILILSLYAAREPGIRPMILSGIAGMMVLNFLAMYFNDTVVKVPGVMLVLQLLGSVLIFVQTALAVDTIVDGARKAGLFPG
jgi:multiple antibiotic resistance protein